MSIIKQMVDLIPDIRSFRQVNGIKQRDLAEILDISLNELMRFERGFLEIPESILYKLKIINLESNSKIKKITRSTGEGYITSKPKSNSFTNRNASIDPNKLHIIDLFCGVGGLSHGFAKTGKFQVTAGVDLLGDRLSTFVSNHPFATAHGQDIRNVSIADLKESGPKPFVIVGGPPCQGFSSLRPFRNVEKDDPRNNLAEEFVRIVSGLQPEWVVFENVVGLITHSRGKILKNIQAAFEEIGYRVSAKVINGASFGLPQKRERLIIIGNRSGKPIMWPSPTHHFNYKSMSGRSDLIIEPQRTLSKELDQAVTFNDSTIDLPEVRSGESIDFYRQNIVAHQYAKSMRNGSNALTMHEATKHSEKMMEIIRHAGANISALPAGMVTSGFSSCYSRLSADEPSTTITVNFVHPASNRCIHPTQDRALTPREGARLQSFEDTFVFKGTRSQIVKQIGNAVPPLIGQVVAETILASV